MVICWNTESTIGIASGEPALATGSGKGKKEHLQWREQEGCVTEMQKKTDNEVVKMMQLQNQVVNHSNETQFTWEVKFMPLIFFFKNFKMKKIKKSLIPFLSIPIFYFFIFFVCVLLEKD